MSSQFNLTQPLYGTTNSNFGGTSSNTFATVFNSQEAFQNAQLTNFQPPQNVDSAITVLQLTSLIPEWKGHFDIIEKMLLSQDQSITNLEEVIAQLESNFSVFLGIYSLTKGMLNNITIHQIVFVKEVEEMLTHHHGQNSLTVRARRQCESALGNGSQNDGHNYQVPNNLSVDLSKRMTEMVRELIDKINDVNEEVQTLSELDLLQVPNYIKSVVENNKTRIIKVSEKLTELLNEIDYRKNSTRITDQPFTQKETAGMNGQVKKDENNSNKNGYEFILGNPVKISAPASGNQTALRKRFMDALGVKQKISTSASEMNDVKLQIRYLRKFNLSYDDSQLTSLREKGFNIMEILVPTAQNQTMLTQGARLTDLTGGITGTTMSTFLPSGGGTGIFGTTTGTGTSNLFGSTTSGFGTTTGATTGSSNLFGTTTTGTGASNLFGSTAGTTTGSSNLFGSTTAGTTTGGSNLFGGTTTGSSNLFGSTTGTTTGATNLFGSSTPGTTNVFGGNTTGSAGLFGGTNTGSASLFGPVKNTTNDSGFFGKGTSTSSGLFGSNTKPKTPGTEITLYQPSTTFGGFNRTQK